jgi:plastocyanin
MKPSKMTLATTLVSVAAFGVFAGACSSSSKSGSSRVTTPDVASTTAAPAAPPPLTITANDYAYAGGPLTVPAGIVDVKFVNQGSVSHEMAFIKVTPGTAVQALVKALAKSGQSGPKPASIISLNGVHDTPAGKTTLTRFNLTPGSYIATCFDSGVAGSKKDGPPHFMRGMTKQITVTGTGGDVLPTAETEVTAHDYGFDVSSLKAGTHTVLFKNTGPKQYHFVEIVAFPKGTTIAQGEGYVTKLLASNGAPAPGVPQPKDVAGSEAAGPGNGNTFTATLEKGITYVALCFFNDTTGGPPHAIGHHMYKVFQVS